MPIRSFYGEKTLSSDKVSDTVTSIAVRIYQVELFR